jgi:creatinine deaminase
MLRRDPPLRHPEVIIGEHQTFLGEEGLLRPRGVALEVVQDEACIEMMTRFIAERPQS